MKDPLSYYLGKLTSVYSVDGNIQEEQVQRNNHTIHTTMRIMEEYHNRLFFYYIIRDNLPESNHDCFINVGRKAFILFLNDPVNLEEPQLNRCVLASGILPMRAQR
ncbi:hypothetical protein C922_05867 [Plasmodium inui San Antonio 1]|uniref:Plasmodium RESA N-terminal domain-containing protein n=1 Tax=Plasmodium inui San Antonio 1 TaxID=1237626 RepID=W6ZS77_9APIC|nr:hypothetical protein C922_05867 [Plasmodium inui San Antonio 1]EUD61352.1 hypothetical protein C922_05867 [Plasmodium inui San Antonio 1]